MFGLFNNKHHPLCDEVAKEVHRQIRDAIESTGAVFTHAEQFVFLYGYLSGLLWSYAAKKEGEASQDWVLEDKYFKYICERVLPGRLWDFFKRGEEIVALNLSPTDVPVPFKASEVNQFSREAGGIDSQELTSANSLYAFLTDDKENIKRY